ncbi:hypothetical protein [Sulfurisoma sediminicola]|uniref:Nmad3 family putative nucleotide modification protein n=1 Tax=Sulfurisoma sediminicola TaxID=1381557 RepID=UPI000EB297FE|nr:hypothetical protein [Sulfurisoma sediminicola]
MKLILSRKGFDSAAGGIASPILPDGRMISLPIPSQADNFTFADINVQDADVQALLSGADSSQPTSRPALSRKSALTPAMLVM